MRKNPLVIVLLISAVFFVIFVAVAMHVMKDFRGGHQTKLFTSASAERLGVIELKGVILDSKKTLEQLEDFGEDSSIRGVILRIDSPGGGVAPSQEVYEAVRRLAKTKPVYASMASMAASGGYYVACGAKKVFANPGTITGSIGVIMQFADLSKLYDWAKVSPYNIKTGKFKDIGSPSRMMGPEEKALVQEMIDNVLAQFRRAVVEGRNLPMEKVVALSDGRIFSGEQAKQAKLVDELGGIEEAAEALGKELGFKGKPKLVYVEKKRGVVDVLFGGTDDEESRSSARGLAGWLEAIALRVAGPVTGARSVEPALMGPLYLLPWAVGR